MSRAETLIVGGGPAGAALAVRLAQAGREVVLLERERGPHDKVCGEFLGVGADQALRRLGLSLTDLGALPIRSVALYRRRAVAEAPLPFAAYSLSRRTLDEALLQRASAAGAEVRRGIRVCGVQRTGDQWAAQVAGAPPLAARQVVIATGKHDLRGLKRPPGRQNDLIGFKQHWRLRPDQTRELAGRVELHLIEGGYAGLQCAEDDRANLCLVVSRTAFADAGGAWAAALQRILQSSPALQERLEGAEPVADRPLAIARLPYGYVRRAADGLWRVGDQAAVIPSFTGEGVRLALESADLAADFLSRGRPADAYQRAFAGSVRQSVDRATTISQVLAARWGQGVAAAGLNAAPRLLAFFAAKTRLGEARL